MSNTVIVQASSRSVGDTSKIVSYIESKYGFDVIDLHKKEISHYDYEFKNVDDDFLPTITKIIKTYDIIIFATPVYWYNMSGILKVFFDRISDLLVNHKSLGRQLRGKQMAMISCSNAGDLKDGFDMPFRESADYLGMTYLGSTHSWIEKKAINPEAKLRINNFFNNLSITKSK
ncbi:flavodoxin family protein [Winogradskyella sp. PG-2]|uniref:flavodoxin family protein n=1 Tax=Winogradskyella sp. PG-2 TaxID=754409 RepID=UPI00045888FE|nr:flavodoxin family protein [Winogradskyella sp. PG-2]BAO74557.1 FMN reductase, NADPH-dependent [Winogradskyella sp. PG-2]